MRYSSISRSELILLAVLIICLIGALSIVVFVAAVILWAGRELGMFYFGLVGSTSTSAVLLSAIFPLCLGWLLASAYFKRNINAPTFMLAIMSFPAVMNQTPGEDYLQQILTENRFLIVWVCLVWLVVFTWWRDKPPVAIQGGEL